MKTLLASLLAISVFVVFAQQRPYINSIDKKSATVGEMVTISGSGFSATPANLKVFFGAGEGTITSSTATQIKVTVPGNATYDPITVINLNSKLSGSSSELFTLSYDGGSFQASGFDTFSEFLTGGSFSIDQCLCDFNVDGLLDIGITHRSSQGVRFFQNQSTINTTNFTEMGSIAIADGNFRSVGIDCGDLDMDGLPDVVFASNIGTTALHIYFYENTSAGSIAFTLRQTAALPPNGIEVRTPRKLKLADIDGDGKKDLVIGSESDNSLFVYLNNHSGGNVSFNPTPIRIAVPGMADAGALDVKDLNNDNLPDISIIAFDEANQPLAFLRNTSSPGTVTFALSTINSLEQRNLTFIGDLNNDSYPEIITSNSFSSRVSIFRNTTSQQGGNISFSSTPVILNGIQNAWGINMGDMNGDGLADLVVSSGTQGVRVFLNTSDGTNITFSSPNTLLGTGAEIVRNLKIGDLNGDAKPDIIFAYNSTSGAPGKFATYINRNCYEPVLDPIDITFCPNNPFVLNTTKTLNATYTWTLPVGTGTITPNGDNATVNITSGSSATVQVTINPTNNGGGTCPNSTTQIYNITGSTPPTAPAINPSAANSVCTGETNFTLTTPTTGLDNYFWTLPDGSTGPNANVLTIATLTAENAGVYTLRTQDGAGCVSNEGSYEVIVNEPPFININNAGQDNFCDGSSVTLSVPNYAGFSYSWERDGSPIAGITNSQTAAVSGAYVAIITDIVSSCENRSQPYTITAVPAPVSAFTTSFMGSATSNTICIDVPLDFTATSTGTGSFALTYDWAFGDTNTGTGASISHTYTSAQTFSTTLTTSYTNINNCSDQEVSQITVLDQQPGDINITANGGSLEKCPSDSVLLELPQNYVSYLWSTGDTDFSAYAKTRSGVSDVTLSVDVVTNIGCAVTTEETVSNFTNSGIGLTADVTITNDTIDLPEGVQMTTLLASNSTNGYKWSINGGDTLSNVGNELLVQPTRKETIVTVTGTDPNGCIETTEVTILLPAILPRKTFSPNGDGLGFDCWEILNTANLQGCKVYVFDNRGRNLMVAESPFENNCVWDGITQGQPAPEGIYYFVLQCNDESLNQTGSIALAR